MTLGFFVVLTACTESGKQVGRPDLGADWPLIVDAGAVDCVAGALVFRHGATTYGLNGIAIGNGYPRINPIWRDDPASPIKSHPMKINIGPLMDLARRECR